MLGAKLQKKVKREKGMCEKFAEKQKLLINRPAIRAFALLLKLAMAQATEVAGTGVAEIAIKGEEDVGEAQ